MEASDAIIAAAIENQQPHFVTLITHFTLCLCFRNHNLLQQPPVCIPYTPVFNNPSCSAHIVRGKKDCSWKPTPVSEFSAQMVLSLPREKPSSSPVLRCPDADENLDWWHTPASASTSLR